MTIWHAKKQEAKKQPNGVDGFHHQLIHQLVVFRKKLKARWWFQMFFIFNPTWGNHPI